VNSLTGMLVTQTAAATGTSGTATCPVSNPNVVGGGYSGTGGGGNGQYANASQPSGGNAWTVTLENTDAAWSVYAVCAK